MRRSAAVALSAAPLLGLAAPWAPASWAAQNDRGLRIEAPEVYYTQMSDPTRVALPVRVDTGSAAVDGVTLTVDASEVQGMVRLYAKRDCAQGAGYVFTCRLGAARLRDGLADLMVLGADKAAEPGAQGTVRFTATTADGRRAEAETVMTAGTPDLWGKKLTIKDAAAGKPVNVWGGVLNHGPIAAHGFGVTVTADPRLQLARRYRNCRYTEVGQSRAYCFFDSRVEPGRSFAFTAPFVAIGGTSLTKGSVSVRIFAPGQDAAPYFDEREFSVRGSGPPVALTPTSPKGFSRDAGHVTIDTDQRADVQAVAGDLRGEPGDVVRIAVGVRNAGPGRVDGRYLGYEITPPDGTTLIPPEEPSPDPENELEYDPWVCKPWRAGQEHYRCWAKSLAPGAAATQTLRFRIEKGASGAPGGVTAILRGGYAQRDPERDNNTAPITVNGAERRTVSLGTGLVTSATAVGLLALAAAIPYGIRRARRCDY